MHCLNNHPVFAVCSASSYDACMHHNVKSKLVPDERGSRLVVKKLTIWTDIERYSDHEVHDHKALLHVYNYVFTFLEK